MSDVILVRKDLQYSEEDMDRAISEVDRLIEELTARRNAVNRTNAISSNCAIRNDDLKLETDLKSCERVASIKMDPLELEHGDLSCETEHGDDEPEAALQIHGDISQTEEEGFTSYIDIKEELYREEHGDDEPEAALETPGDSPDTGVGETSDINIKGEWYREVENTGEDGEDDEVPMENVESSVPSWSSHPTKYKRIHTAGEKMLKCKICGIVFAYSNITTHMKIHTGEKTFECKICERFFSRCHELNAHMKIHTKVKTFNCKICGECFYVFSQLTMHKRIHTGENQFKCKTCEKCFSSSSSLARHKRTHTVKKPYT